MSKKTRFVVYSAVLAALYVVLTHLQNLLLPGSATWAIQCRFTEALCVLAFFTPAAVQGLAVGCALFNLTFAAALPLDWVVGTLATLLAARTMRWLRNVKLFRLPIPGLLMPALWNALLVGWELTVYIGGSYAINALYVALGELIVLLTLGIGLYWLMTDRHLDKRLFG